MKRYFKYILLSLVLGICAGACIEEMEVAQPMLENDGETVLVPRVKSFTNQYITKSDYTGLETKITKIAVLVFDRDSKLVHLEEVSGESVILNKSMLNSSATQTDKLKSATVVMFANMNLADIRNDNGSIIRNRNKASMTPEDLKNYICHFAAEKTVIPAPLTEDFEGFPMVGSTTCDLSATKAKSDPITVDLKILYAKVNFSITAEQGTENDEYEGVNVEFKLNSYSVHNASMATKLDDITASEETPDAATESRDYAFATDTDAKTCTPDTENQFTFYVAENRYNPYAGSKPDYPDYASLNAMRDIYPDGWLTQDAENEDVKTPEEETNGVKYFYDDLIQQYKPNLVKNAPAEAGKPTYVTLTGVYTDYRGTLWNVNYDIYLGKDNAHNFHVDRNSEYKNYITIKGIRNDDSYSDGQVWVDHRVDVTYNGSGVDDHVTITRETLIDSHIEVRPLRVKWTGEEYDGARVYLPTDSNGNLIDWIGIELFTGKNNKEASAYCYAVDKSTGESFPTGKRKYFTTSLIEELQTKVGEYGVQEDDNEKKYIYLRNGECAWIYFDENTGAADREADINLDFYTKSGSIQPVVYKVKQRGLQTVSGYAIESYEEYLHTYDSDDKYNLSTSPVDYTQQGLEWGFTDHKLSQNMIVNATDIPTAGLKNEIFKRSYLYDYFHESDGPSFKMFTNANGSWANASFGTGLIFTDRASANRNITIKDMGTIPENAYQYCLSKNKFTVNEDGEVSMIINWYLPDVYEMKAILSNQGNTTIDLDSDAYYWSSQPSFERLLNYNILGTQLSLINEITEKARAVSKQKEDPEDLSRASKNRIRCVYAKTGIPVKSEDMEDRIPEGIGGNHVVYMKAWNDGSKGYFNVYLPDADEKETSTDWVYNTTETNYPNKDNASSISDEKFSYIKTTDKDGNDIEGFNINPSEISSWTEYDPIIGSPDGYYTTLATYPGLTEYTVQKRTVGNAYKPTTTKKSATQNTTKKFVIEQDKKLPSSQDLKPLDYLTGGSMLNISFSQGNGSIQPAFLYDQLVSGTSSVSTRNWIKPTYSVTEHPLTPEEKTLSSKGSDSASGTSLGTRLGGSLAQARQSAFEGSLSNGWNGAYKKAKAVALNNLKAEISKNYSGWTFNEADVKYTDLTYESTTVQWDDGTYAVKYSNESTASWTSCNSTCTVTLYATVTIRKSAVLPLYSQDDNTGIWGAPVATTTPFTPAINTDELRMYCGNSFTISLSEAAKQQGYEITKVKVHYLGDNFVGQSGGIFGLGADNVYARFVESNIKLSEHKLENQPAIGSVATLSLPGMDYSADGTEGWHQWTGKGLETITLVLADYNVNSNAGLSYSYLYDTSPLKPDKYIIVDQIEVKCSKKKNATFDFKQIYIDSGSLETSGCTVKHITVTAEGGTEEIPTAITADGLKLYSGSKVTFKALDGYVINSITGDPDLTFNGSQQTVEFTDLPEKTISEKIVVLYSKEDNV